MTDQIPKLIPLKEPKIMFIEIPPLYRILLGGGIPLVYIYLMNGKFILRWSQLLVETRGAAKPFMSIECMYYCKVSLSATEEVLQRRFVKHYQSYFVTIKQNECYAGRISQV